MANQFLKHYTKCSQAALWLKPARTTVDCINLG